jgi:hypothetical protein
MKQCFLFLALFLFPLFAIAQSTSATISGGVTDPSGKFIVDADVEIANDATGIVYPAKTNASGMYLVPILPPGHYHVQVSKPGFKTIIKADVTLNVQSALALNFTLPLGASSVSITVEGGSSPINTTDGSVSTVVDQKFVENIPLNGRSFQDLISMTPGVITQSPQAASAAGSNGDFSVNGQRTESNYYTVDGVTANTNAGPGGGIAGAATGGTIAGSTALGTTQTLAPVDALEEFRIQSSTYSAEYGRSPGGQLSLLTRSGTNRLHGSVFDYLRNSFFDANDWFNDHYSIPEVALRQNDFGGALGGPVFIPKLYNGTGRTFFFVAYEGLRLTLPTAATIYYVPDSFMRQQAVPAMQGILNAYPVQNGVDYGSSVSPSIAQFIGAYSLPSAINSTSVRIDHVFNHKFSGFFRYGDTPSYISTRPAFALDKTSMNARTYTLGSTAQFAAHFLNDFRLGYVNSYSSEVGTIDGFGGGVPINLAAAMGASSVQQVVPVIYLYIAGIGSQSLLPLNQHSSSMQWNIVDTVSWLLGRHSFKAGLDYRRIDSPTNPENLEMFSEFTSPAQLLGGAPAVPEMIAFRSSTPVFNDAALFLQDDWRPRPRFSMSSGIRWEVDPPPTELHGDDAYTVVGNLSNPSSLTLASQGTPLWATSWYSFAPRLGLAWTLHAHPGWETVLRGGGGVFFDTANEVGADGYTGLGFEAYTVQHGATIPYTPAQLVVPISVAAPYTSSALYVFPSHLQLPYTLEWNTSVQQAFGRTQAFTISYIGSNGRRLLGRQNRSLASLNPKFGTVYYFPNGNTSNYQGLQVEFQRTVSRGIHAIASYTWSHSLDFGSNDSALPLIRGNSDFDVRDNFQAGASWDAPSLSGAKLTNAMVNGWGLDGRISARTAFPINLTGSSFTDPATGSIYVGELDLVPGEPIYLYGSQYPGGKVINKGSFAVPMTGEIGDAPRNFVRGFGATQLNFAVRRELHLRDSVFLQFRVEAFNIFNHPSFGLVDPTYTDALFGQATKMLNSSLGTMAAQYQQGGARSIQFAIKVHF